jgi:hypothetical protein
MDDGEGFGVGIIDADLLRRQPMLDQLIFDALIAERARRIEAERTKVAGEHFHRRDAAGFDRLHEFGARREGKILATPEAEALGVGEIMDGGGAGRRNIDDAGVRQGVLETKSCAAALEQLRDRRDAAKDQASFHAIAAELDRLTYAAKDAAPSGGAKKLVDEDWFFAFELRRVADAC